MNRRGQPEYAEHRPEQRHPVRHVVVIEGGGVPGEAHPRPPHGHEEGGEAKHAIERRIVVQSPRQRRDGHDEAEVEEQLEPGRSTVFFGRVAQHLGTQQASPQTFRLPDISHATSAKRGRAAITMRPGPAEGSVGCPAPSTSESTTQLWTPTLLLLAITEDLPPKTFDPPYIRHESSASPERLVFRPSIALRASATSKRFILGYGDCTSPQRPVSLATASRASCRWNSSPYSAPSRRGGSIQTTSPVREPT